MGGRYERGYCSRYGLVGRTGMCRGRSKGRDSKVGSWPEVAIKKLQKLSTPVMLDCRPKNSVACDDIITRPAANHGQPIEPYPIPPPSTRQTTARHPNRKRTTTGNSTMSTAPLRTLRGLSLLRAPAARTLSTTARRADAAKPSPTAKAPADVEADPTALGQQAPNRIDVWARGQQHRTKAMSGPRFEQTEGTLQVG